MAWETRPTMHHGEIDSDRSFSPTGGFYSLTCSVSDGAGSRNHDDTVREGFRKRTSKQLLNDIHVFGLLQHPNQGDHLCVGLDAVIYSCYVDIKKRMQVHYKDILWYRSLEFVESNM